ncbi:unnamed protein product [Cylicocyclus nassatus]|uniref:Uncharacterized protein n=1 Tax=Cylicocyclus nassatus TaxID=53992 RepID=A0AA36GP88_CYLNA|nr:unnamed protein product [Cylicocyclus nassatus]
MLLLWILVVSSSLPYLLLPNAVVFASGPGGVIILSAGVLADYAASQNVVINLITILTCTFCYVACYLRIRDPQNGYRVVDRSLFFCALFSSLPFCAEVVRCLLALATFEVKNGLYEISLELWYYLAEVLATSSVWIQLLTNRSVRSILLDRRGPHPQSYGTALAVI